MHVRSASGVSCKGSLELERQSRTGGGEDQQRCGEGGVVGGVTGLRGGAERGIAGIDWWILREYCHVQIVGFDFTEIPRFEWNPWNQQVS